MPNNHNHFLEAAKSQLTRGKSEPAVPINLKRFSHGQITKTLWKLCYEKRDKLFTHNRLRLIYEDTSEGTSFPVGDKPAIAGNPSDIMPENQNRLRIGFVSGRHIDMDAMVEFYLIRHTELQRLKTAADQEDEVYNHSYRLLNDSDFSAFDIIEVYHTGLEPVTLGFYRAVIDVAREQQHRKQLPHQSLIPKIWRSGDTGPWVSVQQLGTSRLNILTDLCEEYPAFFELKGFRLYWQPKRPMLLVEKDKLMESLHPKDRGKGEILYANSQFQQENYWWI